MLDSLQSRKRKQVKYKDYTREFKVQAVALAEQVQNGTVASEALDVPRATLSRWRRHPELNDPLQKAIAEQDIVRTLDGMVWRLIDTMPDKMEDATLSQLATALGICIDKAQLLRGQPTSISQSSTLTRDQALDRIRQAIQQNAITIEPEKEGGEGVQQVGSPGRDTVERETSEVTSSGLLSEKEVEVT